MSVHTRKGVKGTTYRVMWRDSTGRQRSESFPRMAEARRFDAARKMDPDWLTEDGEATAPARERAGGPTVADVWERLAASREVGGHRAATDASLFRVQLAPLHGMRVGRMDALDIRKWMKDLRATKKANGRRAYSDSTIRDALTLLRKILNSAVETGVIRVSPAATVRADSVERPEITEDDVLTPAQFAAVLEAAPPRWRALIAVMGHSGCRLSEALGLTAAHIDWDRGGVWLGIQTTEDVGGHRRLKHGGKTRNARRFVTMVPAAMELLREHLEAYPPAPVIDPCDYGTDPCLIFRTEKGAIPNRSNLRQRLWNPLVDKCGIDRRITMHHLRHSHASWCFAADMKALQVAARLGHSRPSLTMDVYARFLPEDDDSGVYALSEYLESSGA